MNMSPSSSSVSESFEEKLSVRKVELGVCLATWTQTSKRWIEDDQDLEAMYEA